MIHPFRELVIDGVLIAPFVTYAAVALVVSLTLRPLLILVGFEGMFRNPPLVFICLYVLVLAVVVVLF